MNPDDPDADVFAGELEPEGSESESDSDSDDDFFEEFREDFRRTWHIITSLRPRHLMLLPLLYYAVTYTAPPMFKLFMALCILFIYAMYDPVWIIVVLLIWAAMYNWRYEIFSAFRAQYRFVLRALETILGIPAIEPDAERTQREELRLVRMYRDPIENVLHAWGFIRLQIQTCVDFSKRILEGLEEPNLTAIVVIHAIETIYSLLWVTRNDIYKRLVGAFIILRDEGHIGDEDYNRVVQLIRTEIVQRIEALSNNAADIVNALDSHREAMFHTLNMDDNVRALHPQLLEIQQRFDSIQNEIVSRARRETVPEEIPISESLVNTTNRLNELRSDLERRIGLANNIWVALSRQGKISEAVESCHVLHELRNVLDTLTEHQSLIGDIEMDLEENDELRAGQKLRKVNQVLNDTQRVLNKYIPRTERQEIDDNIDALEGDLQTARDAFDNWKQKITDKIEELQNSANEQEGEGNLEQQNNLMNMLQMMNSLLTTLESNVTLITAAETALSERDEDGASESIEQLNNILNEIQYDFNDYNEQVKK